LARYFSLARVLQPSIVVIEDVDLIARQRGDNFYEGTMLNVLLNEMDGLREDSDVLVILTTNRPEKLEPALASRPGRIDQAIEFPLPDDAGRAKLLELYSCGLTIPDHVAEMIVSRTKGASAAFIKELMRRAAQFSLETGRSGRLDKDSLDGALQEMLFKGGSLNLKLIGGSGLGFKLQDEE
jgi:ATP-dependent 26S proteasome regulatory subunit